MANPTATSTEKGEYNLTWRSDKLSFVQYQHDTLAPGEIRIAHLRPSTSVDHPLRSFDISFDTVNLDSAPEYYAVSYAWGDDKNLAPLLMQNGHFLPVTWSVVEFLTYLTNRTDDFRLWIDQICIDQNDIDEKNVQIPLMSKIFSKAAATIVWLGHEDLVSKQAFDYIGKVAATGIHHLRMMIADSEPTEAARLAAVTGGASASSLPQVDVGVVTALNYLLQKRWFSRLWTFQECILSEEARIICGTESCRFDDLVAAVLLASFSSQIPRARVIRDTMLVKFLLRQSEPKSLFWLLKMTGAKFICGDQRDAVYALLGIDPLAHTLSFSVDYRASVKDVYVSTARELVARSSSLEMFGALEERRDLVIPGVPRERLLDQAWNMCPGLPSWVPDWTWNTSPRCLDAPWKVFNAHNGMLHTEVVVDDPNILRVRGKVVDTVVDVGDIPPRYTLKFHEENMLHVAKHILSELIELVKRRPMLESAIDAEVEAGLLRTVTANHESTEQQFTSQEYVSRIWEALMSVYGGSAPNDIETIQVCIKLEEVCSNRRLVSLQENLVALSPSHSRIGDVVCILHGSNVPVMLRSENNHWTVVGQCYVDSLMRGEAVTWNIDDADTFCLV